VAAAVATINIAGLCDPSKRNWYDVDVAETIAAAAKLGSSAAALRDLFASQGIPVRSA
jgi:hypothetical protein